MQNHEQGLLAQTLPLFLAFAANAVVLWFFIGFSGLGKKRVPGNAALDTMFTVPIWYVLVAFAFLFSFAAITAAKDSGIRVMAVALLCLSLVTPLWYFAL